MAGASADRACAQSQRRQAAPLEIAPRPELMRGPIAPLPTRLSAISIHTAECLHGMGVDIARLAGFRPGTPLENLRSYGDLTSQPSSRVVAIGTIINHGHCCRAMTVCVQVSDGRRGPRSAKA